MNLPFCLLTPTSYRLLRSFFALTTHWKSYDPFFVAKAETYKSSSGAMVHLANALNAMIANPRLAEGWEGDNSPLEVAFWWVLLHGRRAPAVLHQLEAQNSSMHCLRSHTGR